MPRWSNSVLAFVSALAVSGLSIHLTGQDPSALGLLAIALWQLGLLINTWPIPHAPTPSQKTLLNLPRRAFASACKHLRHATLGIAGAAAIALISYGIASWLAEPPVASPRPASPFPIALLGTLAFGGYLVRTYCQIESKNQATPHRLTFLKPALDLDLALILLVLGGHLVGNYCEFSPGPWIFLFLASVLIFWILETFFRWAIRFYQPPRIWQSSAPLGTSLLLRPFQTESPPVPLEAQLEIRQQARELADMWLLPQIGRSIPALLACSLLLSWLTTSIHQVRLGETGLRSNFGRFEPVPLSPGIHFSLPWPAATVERFPTQNNVTLTLGHQSDTQAPVLWDRKHYTGERNLLVGEGNELLTFAVPIFYRISDPYRFHTRTQDAAQTIRSAGYQVLSETTRQRSAFDIMTSDREPLREQIKARLQAALDSSQSGLEITAVLLTDIHPPVAVAPAYQEVISAEEDRETYIHAGHDYASRSLPDARSNAFRIRSDAEAGHTERLHAAHADAAAFTTLVPTYQEFPRLFKTRKFYAAFDQSLGGIKKLISDAPQPGQTTQTFVDLRRTLNPEFANTTAAAPQSLIPNGVIQPTDYQKSLNGYRSPQSQ